MIDYLTLPAPGRRGGRTHGITARSSSGPTLNQQPARRQHWPFRAELHDFNWQIVVEVHIS
jgi:hypothetical protein